MKRAHTSGFTLSELLLAFALLAFVLAGALSLFISCIFLNEASRNTAIAVGHAQFVMEDIKNTNFNSLKTGVIDPDSYWDWNASVVSAKGLVALTNESISTEGNWVNTQTKDRLEMTVNISWQDRGLRNRSLSLETLLTEP